MYFHPFIFQWTISIRARFIHVYIRHVFKFIVRGIICRSKIIISIIAREYIYEMIFLRLKWKCNFAVSSSNDSLLYRAIYAKDIRNI